MKKVFLILFLGVSCLVFGQGTIIIPLNNTTPYGVVYSPSSGYGFQNSATQIYVGKPYSNQDIRGRGYLDFNLSSKLTTSIASKTSLKAELVFSATATNTNSNIPDIQQIIVEH